MARRLEHHRSGFPRKSQDDVGADVDAQVFGRDDCAIKTGHVVPPVDASQRVIVGGLESQFQPHEETILIGAQEPQDFRADAVRSRPHGKPDDTRVVQSLIVNVLEG